MKKLVYLAALFGMGLATTAVQADPILWICDNNGDIGRVDVATGNVLNVYSAGVTLTDIAFDSAGNLYGISFTNFYSINTSGPNIGHANLVGSLNPPGPGDGGNGGMNSLVFSSTGVAYAMSNATNDLYTINTSTGAATALSGGVGAYRSSGDLAFHNGSLYLTTTSNDLIRVNMGPVSATLVGALGVSNAFGLANGDNNVLYGVAGTNIYTVNTLTGAATFLRSYANAQGLGSANGAAFYLEATPVPEPSSVVMMLAGGLGLAAVARRRRAV
ncbi:PEP-CTERM sorting domain-containing protein [Paludisphaera rhizosphaerae]|uniref:PEP-CTERM sorting domain-containing protein n=1 Tax=Paludisphaera rhizosphaerae TaxID=2711216 RepID=UPI0013EBB49D|nr:PEP-CTERM sorting domain-containing protein [Paludisphaera rhizosphaerae]